MVSKFKSSGTWLSIGYRLRTKLVFKPFEFIVQTDAAIYTSVMCSTKESFQVKSLWDYFPAFFLKKCIDYKTFCDCRVQFNKDLVIASPDIFQVSLGSDAEFVLLASDGLWDYMNRFVSQPSQSFLFIRILLTRLQSSW